MRHIQLGPRHRARRAPHTARATAEHGVRHIQLGPRQSTACATYSSGHGRARRAPHTARATAEHGVRHIQLGPRQSTACATYSSGHGRARRAPHTARATAEHGMHHIQLGPPAGNCDACCLTAPTQRLFPVSTTPLQLMVSLAAMSSYLYIIKSELPLVIRAFLGLTWDTGDWYLNGNILIVIVTFIVILPLALMKHLGYLGYTSGFSLTCMVFFLCSVIYKRTVITCPLNSTTTDTHTYNSSVSEDVCVAKLFTVNTQTAYSIPIVAFAFVCHPEVLPIYTELRRATKSRMQNVANLSIFAMFVMYLLTAIFGYLTFFGEVESEMLHTYSQVDPLDKLMLCVRVAVLVAVTLTVPVVLFPIRRAIQQLLCPGQDFRWWRHILIAVCLLIAVIILVIYVPNIKDIFGVIGATTAPSLIFILPSIFYIRIVPNEKEQLSSRPKIQASVFASFGFLFMIMSLSFIIVDWVTTGKSNVGGH
uniref:Solute carrier family 38 member 5 n=1 Tax=Leptobrachium leishanense TaxID=445787 RepID=A0A8C5PMH3_9ANUR